VKKTYTRVIGIMIYLMVRVMKFIVGYPSMQEILKTVRKMVMVVINGI
jgi:hypothetical protein